MRCAFLILAVAVSALANTIGVADVKNWELLTDISDNDASNETNTENSTPEASDTEEALQVIEDAFQDTLDMVIEIATLTVHCGSKCLGDFIHFGECVNNCTEELQRQPENNTTTTIAPNTTTEASNATTTAAPATNATKSVFKRSAAEATEGVFGGHREFGKLLIARIPTMPPITAEVFSDLNASIYLCMDLCGETDILALIFSDRGKKCVYDEFIKLHPEYAPFKNSDLHPFPAFEEEKAENPDIAENEKSGGNKRQAGENEIEAEAASSKLKINNYGCEEQCVAVADQEGCLLLCQAETVIEKLHWMSGNPTVKESRPFTPKFQFGGVFTQITEEITSVLDSVVARQQEMMQLLMGCECAGSGTTVTPNPRTMETPNSEESEESEEEQEVSKVPVVTEAVVVTPVQSVVEALVVDTATEAPAETTTAVLVQTVTSTQVPAESDVSTGTVSRIPEEAVTEAATEALVQTTTTAAPADTTTIASPVSTTEAVIAETTVREDSTESATTVPEAQVTEAVVVENVSDAQSEAVTTSNPVTQAPEEHSTASVDATPAQSVTDAAVDPGQNASEANFTEASSVQSTVTEDNPKEEITSHIPEKA